MNPWEESTLDTIDHTTTQDYSHSVTTIDMGMDQAEVPKHHRKHSHKNKSTKKKIAPTPPEKESSLKEVEEKDIEGQTGNIVRVVSISKITKDEIACVVSIFKTTKDERLGLAVKKLVDREGIFIKQIQEGSKCANTALKPGMRILSINDKPCPETVIGTLGLIKDIESEVIIKASWEGSETVPGSNIDPENPNLNYNQSNDRSFNLKNLGV